MEQPPMATASIERPLGKIIGCGPLPDTYEFAEVELRAGDPWIAEKPNGIKGIAREVNGQIVRPGFVASMNGPDFGVWRFYAGVAS